MLRGGTVASSAREDAFAAITGIGVHKTSEHFTVRYPLGVFAYVDDVIDYLETAHDTVVSIGMGYKGMQWKWPGSLVIKDFGRPAPTLHHASSKGLKMLLKTSVLTEENLPDVRRWLGNLMVKSAQSIPDENEFTDDDNFGWNVAVLSFLQEEWSDPAGFIRPVTFGGNESFALRGLPLQASAAAAAQHGAGWSPVVKHLTGLYGMKLLGDIYQVTQTTDREPVGVLLEEIPDPAYNWWPQFVDKYVTGKYYGVEGSVLLLHITSADKYTIRTASDTLKVFSHDTPQVSARMHRVHLDYALVAEDAVMELSLSVPGVNEDYVTLLVYKSKDGVMELAGSGNPVTVSGLRDLTVAGYDIVPIEVISYNDEPYHEDVSTELRCRIAPPPSYNAAYINFTSINVHLEDSYGNDWWDANWYEMWEGVGEWNGNTFTASWANRPLPGIGTTSGDLTITIDPVTWDVVSFRAAQTKLSTTGFTFVDSIIGGNVPCVDKTASPASHKLCQLTGTDACSGMSVYAYRRINNENGAWIELDSFHCQATTYLNVTFWYEPGVLRLPGRR
jgi:hypothetical protein